MNKTEVVFREFKNGEVIALFPYEWFDFNSIVSYMRVGEHDGANYNHVLNITKPAKESKEKSDLIDILENQIGYNLHEIKRINFDKFSDSREKFLKEYY